MFKRSLPLSVQLLLTFVLLIASTTTVLTLVAYRSSRTTLELDAERRVEVAAQNRAQTLDRLLASRQQRANGFLASLGSICGENGRPGALAWELDCVQRALREYRATERATGAILSAGSRRIAVSGRVDVPAETELGALAELVRVDGEYRYRMRAANAQAALTILFSLDDLQPFFEERSGLGTRGEVFLTAADGEFLTPARYSATPTPPGATVAEPVAECLGGPGEAMAPDYRGQLVFHAYRPIPALVGAGCVDAHMSYDEALAPAERLRSELIARGGLFVAFGAFVSLLAAHWIATPVRRLAASARALEAGDFERDIRVSGPLEVRALARAFAASAHSIAQLVSREQAARLDAESANRAKDGFLATVSHELRTPLTAMLGWARLLRLGHLDQAGARKAAAAIERSAEAQARLVDDLLDISRIVAGRLQLRRSALALASPVEAALDAVRPIAAAKRIVLETSLDAAPLVFGDAQRIQQIVSNLLTNALKFTPGGGRVRLSLETVNGRAELRVTDSGSGIPRAFLPHVFERFRQADAGATRQHGGLGLGLAIVRHLVRLHGGEVTAYSAGEGHGATFTVTLPLYEGSALAVETAATRRSASADPRPLESVPVLLVDDDEETLEVVTAILEDAGASVRTAKSASEARQAFGGESRPAVMISDIGMPAEDGYSLMRSLRDAAEKVPAIALTAYARREDIEQAQAAGFQIHMAKPVDARDLVDAVVSLTSEHMGN